MSNLRVFCILVLSLVALCHKGVLIPPPEKLTEENAKCLLAAGYDFVVIRGYVVSGNVDPNAVANIQTAKAAGFTDIDVYMSPCLPCNPDDQTKEMLEALKGQPYSRIYVSIDVPGWREFKSFNRLFLEDVMTEITKGGKKVGIFTTKFLWEDNLGSDYSGASKYDLLYENLNKDPSFKDYKAFGGWRKPYAKHYDSGVSLCSMKMELVYKE